MANQIIAFIDTVTREIIFERSGVASVELDGGLWTIKFKMDAVFGQDPSDPFDHHIHVIQVHYSQNDPSNYDDGYVDSVSVVYDDHETVEFVWTPPLEATEKQGWLYFNIRVRNTDDGSTWSTKVKKIRVNPTVKGNSDSILTPTQSDKITELLARTETLLAAVAGDIDVSDLNTYLLAAHPVGSYYWSDDSTDPGRLFGGTWEEVTDVFLFAAARDNQVGYQAGDSGGSKTHTLTVDEMPSHTHRLGIDNPNGEQLGGSKLQHLYNPNAIFYGLDDVIKTAGGGQAHNNMPPYYATYCWRRTA